MPKDTKIKKIFISYSRKDSNKVYPLVKFLRATGAKVFLDVDSIEYGEQWMDVLENSIREAGKLLVFWSKQAEQSDYVKQEYQLALKIGVKVIPVPIDGTPLPSELAKIQALMDLLPILDKLEKSQPANRRFNLNSLKIGFFTVLLVTLVLMDSNKIRVFIVAIIALIIIVLTKDESSLQELSAQIDQMLFNDSDSEDSHHNHHDEPDND